MHFKATLDLVNVFFLMFFFYILTTVFYRLFDNVLMTTYSLFGRRGDKTAFEETKICVVVASKLILFV